MTNCPGVRRTGRRQQSASTASTPDPVPFLIPLPIKIFLPPRCTSDRFFLDAERRVRYSDYTFQFPPCAGTAYLIINSLCTSIQLGLTPGRRERGCRPIRVDNGKRKRMTSPYDRRPFQRSQSVAKRRYLLVTRSDRLGSDR